MRKMVRKMKKILALILAVVAFIVFPAINMPIAYADYYQAYTGSGTINISLVFRGSGDSVSASYNYNTPNPNPLYVPGNMGAGTIKVKLHVNYSSHTTYWSSYTTATIPVYGIDNNGNQTQVAILSFNASPAANSDISFGQFFLSQNYRGFRLGNPSASCPNYNTGSADLTGYLTFEFNAIIFASTESQFTTLSNNAANAATNAQNAYNAANAAKSSADAAKSSADVAKTFANTAATNAQNAYNAANTAATNAQNAYNAADIAAAQTIYNGQSAAYWAYLAAQGGVDITPSTIQKIGGLNGATCTTTGTFYVVVQATDNKAGQLQARAQVDGGTWTGWYNIPQNAIPVTLSSTGAHTITVEVKDAAGNSSQATMTAFRV